MSIDAMKQALDALNHVNVKDRVQVITALRERLARPAQQPLTDEEIEDAWERITGHSIFGGDRAEGRAMYLSPDEVTEFARAIEAKLKEKNT